ncbi:MAG: Malate dehydrogenase (EC [uncultured Caballeronia sp.]|nr:MAG: Malate dehydrogenase (EC [uncultured Caballeronia sp.]
MLTIDGRKGFGQVVAHEAMEHGIARAKKLGVCAVGLRNTHHIGPGIGPSSARRRAWSRFTSSMWRATRWSRRVT